MTATRLRLTVDGDLLARLCLLTGGGFRVEMPAACSVRELLCGQLGVAPEYLEGRIQTIFLNSRPVDDPGTATVTPGATLALSGPMPGLAGAIFRKGGYYAMLRSRVSGSGDGTAAGPGGHVVLKLFNMVQQELGPAFLRRGIRIPGPALADLLRGPAGTPRASIFAAELDGKPIAPASLLDTAWPDGEVFLSVSTPE